MLIKQKSLSLPRNLALMISGALLIVFSAKIKDESAIPLLFNGLELWSSASDTAKLFAKNFSGNSNLEDSGMSLPAFSSRTKLKLHNISVISKLDKKVITNLDLSKGSGLDCISMLALKNCESDFSYMLDELLNICLKESIFQILKGLTCDPVFKNLGERSTAKKLPPC